MHGAPRFTGDLDVFIRPTLENADRLLEALRSFGFTLPELSPQMIVESSRMLQMGIEPVQIHVMGAISGVGWDEAWITRTDARLGTRDVPILGRHALLRNKRAAGRPKDLADIDALTSGDA